MCKLIIDKFAFDPHKTDKIKKKDNIKVDFF